MEFHITEDQRRLQERCRSLAADFATRAAAHDRDATIRSRTMPRSATPGFYALNVPRELGGAGVGLLGWSLAAEELARLRLDGARVQHAPVRGGPDHGEPAHPARAKARLAKMVVQDAR